ncbi:UV-stimulated scaffold protein A isoform X2 [Syngnathoides biaculeatus]|uniref:UV-stimulated scaffold protein A isoform X2 n=1 Tax=Syngnathoides biaculeatus TaxID=300417 RepID=UPI002ADDAFA9|nr:UV-stimulated scaffold protein A isoform X2 [Syngnathoides biaculeatus]
MTQRTCLRCRFGVSNDCIDHVYHSIMSQLNQEHAVIRLSAFQIASELFLKSHHFRTLLVDNFQEFLELTVETNFERPLPPPKLTARKLRSLAVQTIQSWQSLYGSAYKKLELGYHFLKHFKKVDFQDAEARTVAERERETKRQRKMERIYSERLKAAMRDMEDSSPDIEVTLTELDSCLMLLCPQFPLRDSHTTKSQLQTTTQCLSEDEQPCCSKNVNDRTEKIDESKERWRKEENNNYNEEQECVGGGKKQKRCENELNRSDKQKKEMEGGQMFKIKHYDNKDRFETEDQGPLHEDSFIQNSGLISRSYCLALNLSHEVTTACHPFHISQCHLRTSWSKGIPVEPHLSAYSLPQCQVHSLNRTKKEAKAPVLVSRGPHIKETEDNEAIFSTLLELQRLLKTKHLPAVRHWVQVFTNSGADQSLLRRSLDLKNSVEVSLLKLSELNIDSKTKMASSFEESDDDSDFIEVPEKEELQMPGHIQVESGSSLFSSTPASSKYVTKSIVIETSSTPPRPPYSYNTSLKRVQTDEWNSTSGTATFPILQKDFSVTRLSSPSSAPFYQHTLSPPNMSKPSKSALPNNVLEESKTKSKALSSSQPGSTQSNKDQMALKAPVVPFGLDLYYWGKEQPYAGKITKLSSQHQFWVPSEVVEEVQNKELIAESTCRFITFSGKFIPVTHYCNAPLGNGKLCKRQDRLKCPFHGRMVPRDQEGRPCIQEDCQREEQDWRKKKNPHDWHDPGLLRDIEMERGQKLCSDRMAKPGKGKKKKYPNLSNLKQSANTSRSRLEKRIFNKSAMHRVAQTMNKVDCKKHEKFSNQFNYALN